MLLIHEQIVCGAVQEDHETMLKTIQELLPDDLMNAELSSLDAFCLDSMPLPPASCNMQAPAATFTFTPGQLRP